MPKKKRGCKLITALFMCAFALPCFAEDVKTPPKITIEKSYFSKVEICKQETPVQEIVIKNSFLATAKIRHCTCDTSVSTPAK